ncbi:hypothetical protein AK830_g1358 [Neonectria ditissima]|uniref:FAS1 domain-containing protein n=1 Tax=Neonectria ditissima TaxID=78410 RepID=A0A0P7BN81_9HYPO|nr:hypothetical protein AK830_g1358 [Neonectria ditissima]
MRFSPFGTLASLGLLALTNAQDTPDDLASAISQYPGLSLFRSLLLASPDDLTTALSKKTTNITVLIPTDDAINQYLSSSGVSNLTELRAEDVQTFFQYHVMTASLKGSDFQSPRGVTVPTLLQKEEYNNRSAGPVIHQQYGAGAEGQVLFASAQNSSKAKRQSTGSTVDLRAGLAQDAQMTAVDGSWGPKQANSFQIVDSVLAPPRNCSTTARSISDKRLSALDTALQKTEMWPILDTSFNVTCLAPSTEAFKKAGNPQTTLSKGDLTDALLTHTLKEVTYTNYLEDGMVLETFNNMTVRVKIKNNEIYFNNAKVIEGNVLTNNGLIHILDAVIQVHESDQPNSTSSDNTPTSTAATVPTESTGAASPLSLGYPGIFTLMACVMLI